MLGGYKLLNLNNFMGFDIDSIEPPRKKKKRYKGYKKNFRRKYKKWQK